MTTNEFLNEVINCLEKSDKMQSFSISPKYGHIFSSVIVKAIFKDGTTNEYRLSITNYSLVQDEYFK